MDLLDNFEALSDEATLEIHAVKSVLKFQCHFSQNANFWSVMGRYVRTIRAIPTKIGTDTFFI